MLFRVVLCVSRRDYIKGGMGGTPLMERNDFYCGDRVVAVSSRDNDDKAHGRGEL